MNQIELDFNKANSWAKDGINRAVLGADNQCPGWSEEAFEFVKRFSMINKGQEFMAEDIRAWAYSNGLPRPSHERAWGGVIIRSTKIGAIRVIGRRRTANVNAHNAWACYYTS